MPSIVICGSAKNQEGISHWVEYWSKEGDVLDWPRPINQADIATEYPRVFVDFYRSITNADIVFIANETRHGIEGYIGSGVFAEIAFAIAHREISGRLMRIILANDPSPSIQGYDEILLWKNIGWIEIYALR